jgi:hypothetical protein
MTMSKKPLSEMASDELVAEAYKYAESAKEWSYGQEAQRANDIAFAQLLLHFAEYQAAAVQSQFFKRFTPQYKQHGTITGRIPSGQMPPENWQTMSPEARREWIAAQPLWVGSDEKSYSVDDLFDQDDAVRKNLPIPKGRPVRDDPQA